MSWLILWGQGVVGADQGAVQHDPVAGDGRAPHPLHHLLPQQLGADTKSFQLLEHSLLTVREVFCAKARIWPVTSVLCWPVTPFQPGMIDNLTHVQPGA